VYACPSRIARPADNDHTTETWHQPWCSPASAMVPGGQAGFPCSPSAVLAAVTADDVTAASGAGEISGKWQAAKCAGPRVPLDGLPWQADMIEHLLHPAPLLPPRAEALRHERFAQDRAGPHPRIERRVGIPEHELDLPALPPVFAAADLRQVPAPEVDDPLVGRSRPTITLPIVVLPQPDSPTSPNVSPRRMLRCRLGSV